MNSLSKTEVSKLTGWHMEKINKLLEDEIIKLNKESINEYKKIEEYTLSNYISSKDALEQLGYNRNTEPLIIHKLNEEGHLKIKTLDYPINWSTLWVEKVSLENFIIKLNEEYIELNKVHKKYDISQPTLKERLKEFDIHSIKLKTVHLLKNELEEVLKYDLSYYTLSETSKILNIKNANLLNLIKINTFKTAIMFKGIHRISKGEVEKTKKEIERLKGDYYLFEDIKEKYDIKQSHRLHERIDAIERPPIASAFDCRSGGSKYLYCKKSADLYFKNSRTKYAKEQNEEFDEPVNYFVWLMKKLETETKQETFEHLINFGKVSISTSNANKKSLTRLAKDIYEASVSILNFKIDKEIHQFSKIEANNLIINEKRKHIKKRIYLFLVYILKQKLCKFTIKDINNPYSRKPISEDKDVYEFEDFIKFHDYANDINMHLQDSINNQKYASTWLYALIHITNAWRHSDVVRIPSIYPETLGITSIDWFIKNELSLPQAQSIINQISNYELVISKTGMKRHFFCHQNISKTMATSMIICEFHRREIKSDSLIHFGTKDNDATNSILSLFFSKDKAFKKKNMKFSSLKMNRSLMEHLFYSIQRREGKGNSAFELVQKMRNHKSDITKVYIRFSEEGKGISHHLFERGEFGYIYDQLIDVLTEESEKIDSLDKRTENIKQIKEKMDVIEVETTVGFLDKMESEKNSIITQIKRLSEEESFEYIRKIYLKEMPSKIENIQCFSYPKCHKPSCEHSCYICPFAIPNTYALTSLSLDIQNRLEKIKQTSINGVIKKEKLSLMKSLDLLYQAIQEFGEEFVWSFIEGGEKALEEKLSEIN